MGDRGLACQPVKNVLAVAPGQSVGNQGEDVFVGAVVVQGHANGEVDHGPSRQLPGTLFSGTGGLDDVVDERAKEDSGE